MNMNGKEGREDKRENDLFFTCAVVECIGRMTKNRRAAIVQALGVVEIERLLKLADVLHCEPVENTARDLIARCGIAEGNFDNVAMCKYRVPTHFDIAKVYKRLIAAVAAAQGIPLAEALVQVYTSWMSDKIDNYNSSMYFENPQYLYESYRAGEPLEG